MRFTLTRLALLLGLALGLFLWPASTAAHAQLESSSPEADALLSIPPHRLILTFTEPLVQADIAVTAVDEQGRAVPLSPPTLDPANDRRVFVSTDGFAIGTYTVTWSNRSSTDGHTLSGSFAFRIGGTDRAPAAATVEGERPAGWGVITRWLAFLGAVMAAGLLLVATRRERIQLARWGLAVGLLATALEPLLLSRWPPGGSAGSSVADALRAEPDGWWLRLAGLGAALLLSVLPVRSRLGPTLIGTGALLGLSGLALTSHGAGRETYAWAAVAVTFVHNAAVALWVGALLLVSLRPAIDRWAELRQFARRALPLALVALVTGIVNAVVIVPSISSLTDADYGRVLIGKVAIVLAVLALAGYHHWRLRRPAPATGALRRSVRFELGLIALAVAFASALALLSPPQPSQGDFDRLALGMSTRWETTNDQIYVRLDMEPGSNDEMAFTVYATDGPPLTVDVGADGSLQRVDHPPLPDVQLVRMQFGSLNHAIAPRTLDLSPLGDGRFIGSGVVFSVDGWWRAVVTVRRAGVAEDVTAEFLLRSPDPNLVGFDAAVTIPGSDPTAEALYQQAIAQMRSVPWLVSHDAVSGAGGVETGTQIVVDGAYDTFSPNVRIVLVDGKRYFQDRDGAWSVSEQAPPDQSTWLSEYAGATNFVLGIQETLDGRLVQPIMFYVPATTLTAAFYAWWIDVESGQIVKIGMISRNHYMNRIYDWSARPAPITPPIADR